MLALVKRKPTNPPAWYQGLDLIERPEPPVSPERPVKIKIISAGVCGTDVGVYLGKDSLAKSLANLKQDMVILGHEFCGEVADIHESGQEPIAELLLHYPNQSEAIKKFIANRTVPALAADPKLIEFLGQNFYVTAEMHFTCRQCWQCRIGEEHLCQATVGKGLHEDGAYASYMVAPANRLVLIEKGEIPPQIISFMDAIGNAVHTAQTTDLAGKNVLITGAGVQGLASCAVVRQLGADKIFVTDVVDNGIDKLGIAKKMGADAVFNVGTLSGVNALREQVRSATDNTGMDVVFEMSGNYAAYDTALANIRLGGVFLLLGLPAGKFELDFTNQVIFKGLRVQGIYGRRVFDTWNLMRNLLTKGLKEKILASGMITHELPLAEYEKGFQALINGQAIKVLLKP